VFLGSDAVVQAMGHELEAAAKHTVPEIPKLQRRALAKSLDYYRETFGDAKIGMVTAYATWDYTMQAIAGAFGVHCATVSRAVSGNECCIARPDTVERTDVQASLLTGGMSHRHAA
jgi:putative transposase